MGHALNRLSSEMLCPEPVQVPMGIELLGEITIPNYRLKLIFK